MTVTIAINAPYLTEPYAWRDAQGRVGGNPVFIHPFTAKECR